MYRITESISMVRLAVERVIEKNGFKKAKKIYRG